MAAGSRVLRRVFTYPLCESMDTSSKDKAKLELFWI